MSFRDCRNFIEHLRALGYPNNVSLENFRQPNFPLVAELLKWLVERFDPDSHLDGGVTNMDERILLIRAATQFMMTKASIKLNPKKLYGADGYAVRELLKITTVLYDALNVVNVDNDDDVEDPSFQFDITSKIDDLKKARQLATEITKSGAILYDLLGKEVDYRESREQAISKPLDISAIEATIDKACATYEKELAQLQEQTENIAASEASLDNKIEKKKAELERSEKRLQAMQKIKPAYQVEFKNHELELEKLYDEYVLKMRCIEALKQQLSTLEAAEAEIAEERRNAALKLIQKYEAEDVLVNISDTDEFEYEDSPRKELKEIEKRPSTRPKTRLRVRTAVGGDQPKVFGSMTGDKHDDFSIDDSIIGDDDDLLKDNLDDEDFKALNMGVSDDLGSLGSSDESELNLETRNNMLGSHGTNGRNLSRAGSNRIGGVLLRGQGSLGSNHSLSRRAPSTKPMQEILSDDDF